MAPGSGSSVWNIPWALWWGFGAGLFPVYSSLLRECWLVSFLLLINVLKFSMLSYLIRGRSSRRAHCMVSVGYRVDIWVHWSLRERVNATDSLPVWHSVPQRGEVVFLSPSRLPWESGHTAYTEYFTMASALSLAQSSHDPLGKPMHRGMHHRIPQTSPLYAQITFLQKYSECFFLSGSLQGSGHASFLSTVISLSCCGFWELCQCVYCL